MTILFTLSASAQWAWPGYQARLILDLDDRTASTAALGFCFGGEVQSDGKDIRVVSVTGMQVKSQVLFCDPTGVSQIAFAPIAGLSRYFIYFNNPDETQASPEPWEPTSGLLLETRQSPGAYQYADSLADCIGLFQKADQVLGKMFVPSIFFSESPFHATGRIVNHFKGFLNITVDGPYIFATSSTDSSFAGVDGKLVCQSTSVHDNWTAEARYTGTNTLTKGVHLLEYYQIQRDSPMQCVLVWKTPEELKKATREQHFQMIPAKAFTPVAQVKVVAFEKANVPFAADFDSARTGDVLRGGTQATVFRFTTRTWGTEKPTDYNWDFGDGTTGTGDTVDHAYFGLWQPQVQLTLSKGSVTDKFTRVLDITPAEGGDENEAKTTAQVADIVKTYSARDLEPKSAALLIDFLKGAGLNQVFLQVIEQQMNSPQGIPPDKMDEYLPLLAAAYFADGQFAKARDRYQEMIQQSIRPNSPETRKIKLRAAECLVHLRQFDDAITEDRDLEHTGSGDMLSPVARGFEQDRVDAAIRQKKFDGARDLLEEFILKNPMALEDDVTFMLRGKIEYGQKRWEAAITDFEFMEKVEPRSNYLPEALFLTGQSYVAQNKPDEATKTFGSLIERFGKSPYADEAKKALAKLKE